MGKKVNEMPEWPDARGWIGIGTFAMSVMILWMLKEDATLREDEFFKVIATAIVLTGFIQGVVGWAYTATKGGGELADANAKIVADAATASATRTLKDADKPQDVKIVGQKKPVAVTETDTPTPAAYEDNQEDAAPRGRT